MSPDYKSEKHVDNLLAEVNRRRAREREQGKNVRPAAVHVDEILDEQDASALNRIYTKLVPEALREKIAKYAKAVVGAVGSGVLIVNSLAPDWSDEAQVVSNVVILIGLVLGVAVTPNKE